MLLYYAGIFLLLVSIQQFQLFEDAISIPSLLKSSRYQIGYWYLTSRRIMGSQNWCGLEIQKCKKTQSMNHLFSGNFSDFPTAGKKKTSLITDWISQNCDWMNPSRLKQLKHIFDTLTIIRPSKKSGLTLFLQGSFGSPNHQSPPVLRSHDS